MRRAAWLCLFALLPPPSSRNQRDAPPKRSRAWSQVPTASRCPGSCLGRFRNLVHPGGAEAGRADRSDGRFSIPRSRLTPKSQVTVCAAGFETHGGRSIRRQPLKIALRPVPAPGSPAGSWNQTGKPVAKFRLMAVMAGTRTSCALRGPMLCPPPETYAMSQSDAQGRFVLETLQPGWYRVSGSGRGLPWLFFRPDPDRSRPEIRSIRGDRPGRRRRHRQRPHVATASRLPAPGSPIKSGYFGVETTSDAQGHFRLGGLAAGMRDLFVEPSHARLGAEPARSSGWRDAARSAPDA